MDPSTPSVTISSEVAAFGFAITAQPSTDGLQSEEPNNILGTYDSQVEPKREWNLETEYVTPNDCFVMRDISGNVYEHHYPYWYKHPPYFKIALPLTLRGSTLTWLLRDGMELVKILEVERVAGADDLEHFHHVLCLGIQRDESRSNHGRRMGMFCIPKEYWVRAQPREKTIVLF